MTDMLRQSEIVQSPHQLYATESDIIAPQITLLLPAYCEGVRQEHDETPGDLFKQTIESQLQFLEKEFLGSHELIVINDGSVDRMPDGTYDPGRTTRIAKAAGAKVIEYDDGINRGRGFALRRGFTESTGGVRLYTDADGSYSNETLYELYSLVADSDTETAIAQAYRSETSAQHESQFRKYGHSIMHRLCEARFMAPTGVRDPQAGAKAYRSDAAVEVWSRVTVDRWAADRQAHVIARKLGFVIEEVSADIIPHGDSRVKIFKDAREMVRDSYTAGREARKININSAVLTGQKLVV